MVVWCAAPDHHFNTKQPLILINFTNPLELIAKNIDKFYFIVYYYHIVNEKYQVRTNIDQNCDVGEVQHLQEAVRRKAHV